MKNENISVSNASKSEKKLLLALFGIVFLWAGYTLVSAPSPEKTESLRCTKHLVQASVAGVVITQEEQIIKPGTGFSKLHEMAENMCKSGKEIEFSGRVIPPLLDSKEEIN